MLLNRHFLKYRTARVIKASRQVDNKFPYELGIIRPNLENSFVQTRFKKKVHELQTLLSAISQLLFINNIALDNIFPRAGTFPLWKDTTSKGIEETFTPVVYFPLTLVEARVTRTFSVASSSRLL